MSAITDNGTLKNSYQNFIAMSRYAKWIEDKNRRETWKETVNRYIEFMKNNSTIDKNDPIYEEIYNAILYHEVMPSMRSLMTAGPALERDHIAGYNCSFIAVDNIRAFDETVYVLMNGTGVGFSVEEKYVSKLPTVADEFFETNTTIVVEDSKLGWAKAFKELLALLVQGQIPKWDVSKVRPAGSRLRTFGGRASGPEPLESLFQFSVDMFKAAAGRKLKPIEAHDLMTKIAEIVVVGGVRRSALISLSDLDDYNMATAKSGNWWEAYSHRALANNSAVYNDKPNTSQFLSEWKNLYDSKSGERGIFNLGSVRKHIDNFGRRDSSKIAGTNPCGEILLRSNQFCNLTEVVIGPDDSQEDILRKIRIATIIGTWQSSLTNFKYIRKIWKDNSEEERLLGVSFTGVFGNVFMSTPSEELIKFLDSARNFAVSVNAEWAEKFNINASAAVTCIKPSGTVSQLTGVSSGIHPWYSQYYIRTVRADNKDPLTMLMKDEGIPWEPDVMKPESTSVFSFPIKAPENVKFTKDLTAIEHLEIWKIYREHWTEHNPSVTINVRENEWPSVGAWVFDNFDAVGGVSFLPMSEHVYKQAPYQQIDKETYDEYLSKMPKHVNWQLLPIYELEDTTKGTQEFACTSFLGCEVVDNVA